MAAQNGTASPGPLRWTRSEQFWERRQRELGQLWGGTLGWGCARRRGWSGLCRQSGWTRSSVLPSSSVGAWA